MKNSLINMVWKIIIRIVKNRIYRLAYNINNPWIYNHLNSILHLLKFSTMKMLLWNSNIQQIFRIHFKLDLLYLGKILKIFHKERHILERHNKILLDIKCLILTYIKEDLPSIKGQIILKAKIISLKVIGLKKKIEN